MNISGINLNEEVFVIAEIGNNHEGSYSRAEEMIGVAARCGASAVKFQTIIPEELTSIHDQRRLKQLRKFTFSQDDFEKLHEVAQRENIIFLSTPFDLESLRFLNKLVPAYKVASGDNTFYPLLEAAAITGKPLIMSAGILTFEEIKSTVKWIKDIWQKQGIVQELAVLHCVVSYPVAPQFANLRAMNELQKLDVTIGYSDHTLGINAAVIASVLGARIIEKHFTLDKNFSTFRDHQLSADPKDLKEMISRIREAAVLLGDGVKRPQLPEKEIEKAVRRSIVAKHDLFKDAILKKEDISWVRPAGGMAPGSESEILGKSLVRDVARGEKILPDDVVG